MSRTTWKLNKHDNGRVYIKMYHPSSEGEVTEMGEEAVDYLAQQGEAGWYVGNATDISFWITK